ncbi:hypothetical protein Tco_0282274 [Tanacetum coccineum]
MKHELCYYINHSTDDCYRILYCLIYKGEDHKTSAHISHTASLKTVKNFKAQPYQYASPSKQIMKLKVKSFPPCTHYGFNDHHHDDCCVYPECKVCGSNNHATLRQNHFIFVNRGVLAVSSQSSESLVGVSCNTYGSAMHLTSNHNDFDHFKRGRPSGPHSHLNGTPCQKSPHVSPLKWHVWSPRPVMKSSYKHRSLEPTPKEPLLLQVKTQPSGPGEIRCHPHGAPCVSQAMKLYAGLAPRAAVAALVVASIVVSLGDGVIRNLFQGSKVASSAVASTMVSRGGGDGHQVLFRGAKAMRSAIAASMDGVQPKPIVTHHPLSGPPQSNPPGHPRSPEAPP